MERYNILQHGPIKGTTEYSEEEKECKEKKEKSVEAMAWSA